MSDRITAVRNELSVAKRAIDSARMLADGIEAQVSEYTGGLIDNVNGRVYIMGHEINPLATEPGVADLVYMPDFTTTGDGGVSKRFRYIPQYHRHMYESNLLYGNAADAENASDALVALLKDVGKIGD